MAGLRDDLIVAPATAAGRAAVAIVRVSGPGALALATRLTGRDSWVPRRATRARLHLGDGISDDALVTAFVAPHSFTGEDVVELAVHGNPVVVGAVLDACTGAGARLARAGEFTFRAYLNGRLDLLQAEAVGDLVNATTPAQVRVASAHLDGALSARIVALGDELASLRALLEASLDFPDEGFHFISRDALASRLHALRSACEQLLGSSGAGQRLREGATVVIAGRPNAGKSSLFNALLGRQRAIVTDVAGTTRDLLTETIELGGVPATLVDTAGVRDTTDVIEREGVTRAREAASAADFILLVVDPGADAADDEENQATWRSLPADTRLCVVTRLDFGPAAAAASAWWWRADHVWVSTTTGAGMDVLHDVLAQRLGQVQWDGATLTRVRHRSLVTQVATALDRAADTVASGGSEEYVLVDVVDGLHSLEELRRVEQPGDVLETIFGTFCIGK